MLGVCAGRHFPTSTNIARKEKADGSYLRGSFLEPGPLVLKNRRSRLDRTSKLQSLESP